MPNCLIILSGIVLSLLLQTCSASVIRDSSGTAPEWRRGLEIRNYDALQSRTGHIHGGTCLFPPQKVNLLTRDETYVPSRQPHFGIYIGPMPDAPDKHAVALYSVPQVYADLWSPPLTYEGSQFIISGSSFHLGFVLQKDLSSCTSYSEMAVVRDQFEPLRTLALEALTKAFAGFVIGDVIDIPGGAVWILGKDGLFRSTTKNRRVLLLKQGLPDTYAVAVNIKPELEGEEVFLDIPRNKWTAAPGVISSSDIKAGIFRMHSEKSVDQLLTTIESTLDTYRWLKPIDKPHLPELPESNFFLYTFLTNCGYATNSNSVDTEVTPS